MKRTLYSLLTAVVIVSTMISALAAPPAAKPRPTAARTPLQPSKISLTKFAPLNFRDAAAAEASRPPAGNDEIEDIEAPQSKPDVRFGVPIPPGLTSRVVPQAVPASPTGPSPGPLKTFKAEFLSATSIPPDTMGAVGTTHIVSVTNDRMRIQTRDGVEVSRMTLTAFWAGVTIKGAAIAAFDPKVMFDRFNNRFILISSGNGQNVNSGAMFAVSATADPTGTWYRWSVAADPASTAAGGHWIDYPTIGHNKNWIVVDENVFNFGTAGSGFWGTQIYVLDKQAAYANTLGTISLFQADFTTGCVSPFEGQLGCGFTMAPTLVEDNTTDEVYMVEDWDNIAGQLRLSKVTGTPAAPVLTVGTQFPQSTNSWMFNAARITTAGTQSGGYLPQRQLAANLPSGTRIMANDSRIQNSVLRNGSLWCTHTVMLAATPTAAGSGYGTGNPDVHSGIQWWEIDPTIESGTSQAPIQLARIEDPTADNCHNGANVTKTTAPCLNSVLNQVGEFFAFPNISVNQNDDVLIGFSRFSPLTYPNSGYVIRRSTDPINTTRDPVIFRPGQANYNIGAGSGATRQNRWGDYSASQTDPINDTDFWSVQEYAGTQRNDFLAPSYAGPWETWWALIRPTSPVPSTSGNLIISEFRLRGPQGVRDEFVEVYNPAATPVIVNTTDNSEGWALGYSTNGTTITGVAVIPNGTVIPPRGHYLMVNNPDNTAGGTSALTYSLNTYPSITVRGADSDTGWTIDLADNGGLALFKTANTANFNAGTRMDSVGFASIAAGLFREGNGIPAITAATPLGQMTFYRDSASGLPVDTDTNENDFIFADPVVEVLGSTPRLGAAGPQNLDGPIHDTGAAAVVASLLDAGAGQGSPANLFRDPTVVPNGAFGTITFRRTFTNNTGADLPRLRYRIVNITTTPVTGPNADLRAINSSTGSVTLSGGGSVTVNGTTIETPPAQLVGGAFNSSYSANGIALATPLLSGASVNLAFTVGVQTTGTYNFCLEAEGVPVAASSVLCFAGTTENTPPTITPGAPVSRTAGSAGSIATIATVSDLQDAPGSLTVTATSVPTGITITGISNSSGTVSATVTAGLTAVSGTNNVTLQVADSEGATNTATFVVNVIPVTPTITPGGPTTFCAGGSVLLTSSAAAGNQWYLDGNPIGGATNQTYSATLGGSYTVVVTENASSSAPSAAVVVTVNPIPPTPTITPGGPTTFCAGGSVTLNSSSASGNQWYLNGNPIGGATNQAYAATASGDYTVVVTTSGCPSAPSAITTVTVTPLPATPTITPGGPTTFCTGGSVTLNSSSASGNQWYLNGNPIGGATSQAYVASVAGDYTVVVTTTGCSSAASATTTVTINPNPNATITAPGSVSAGSTGNAASVANAGVGATYTWGITNGTITGGAGTANITFTAGAVGTVGLSVTVTTGAGCSDAQTANVTVGPATVSVTLVSPANGSSLGGTNVTISGSGFNAGATVTFGGSAATNVVVVNSGQITAKTPAHAAGAVNVTVTNTDTTNGTLINGYTYVQQNFDPNGDSMIDPSDIFYLVAYLFTGGPAPAGTAGPVLSGDANGDGVVDPADIFYVVNYLFGGGPAPHSRIPGSPVTTSIAAPMSGALSLGQAVERNGHWFVPVIVTMDPGSSTPQAFSLRVKTGKVADAVMHRGAALEPIFEISRRTDDAISYLVAFNERAPFTLGASRSAVIAEIEVSAAGAMRLEIDAALTMLVDGDGTHKATVANHTLRVSGTSIGRTGTTTRQQQLNQQPNEQN